jgi:hypothetical protein
MILTDKWDEFRARGCHIVPVGGKDRLILPTILAHQLGIPLYLAVDSDGHVTNEKAREYHKRDNAALLKLFNQKADDPFPKSTLWSGSFLMWESDIGDVLKAEATPPVWDKAYGEVRKSLGSPDGDFTKNTTAIGNLLTMLRSDGVKLPSLDKACAEILNF